MIKVNHKTLGWIEVFPHTKDVLEKQGLLVKEEKGTIQTKEEKGTQETKKRTRKPKQ